MRTGLVLWMVGMAALLPGWAVQAAGDESAPLVIAEAGSVGGTIGRGQVDLSGGAARPPKPVLPPAKPAQKPNRNRLSPKPSTAGGGGGCGRVAGKWNSWASGLFGRGDTQFQPGGTVIHSSGIRGRWSCSNGNLSISWGRAGQSESHRVSPDGRSITGATGSVGFRR